MIWFSFTNSILGILFLYNIIQNKLFTHALKTINDVLAVVFDDILLLPNNEIHFYRDIISPFLSLSSDSVSENIYIYKIR
jgi:hypothetical protein